jgi:Fe-S cluster assembly protein SufD
MIEVTEEKDTYLADFARFEKAAGGDRLLPTRKAAIARFAELGFPTTQHEEWKYTNVAPIVRTSYKPAGHANVAARQLAPFLFGDEFVHTVVFLNGWFSAELSRGVRLPAGVEVTSLRAALKERRAWVELHLARYANFREQPFTALNTAFMQDGACVYIPKGAVVEEPIHLLFVTVADGQPQVCYPRVLIVAEQSSQATVIESYAGLASGPYLTNAVTEIVVGENAVLDHYKVQRESEAAFHMSTFHLRQLRSSNVTSHLSSLGGALVRHDIDTVLDGDGCDCTLNGLYVLTGQQHCDNHLRVEHAKPHGDSREFFKGILDGEAHGAFSGRIIVRQDAQKTDAKQTNMNLLLSEDARVDSKPQLEIFADDVKCTHGATIGQIDEEALFYLRSRGLSKEAARSLLVFAFASESIDRVRFDPLRLRLAELILTKLPQGEMLREAISGSEPRA